MSAWIVDKVHIDAMVQVALDSGTGMPFSWYHENERHQLTINTKDTVGSMLWRENHMSVNARYDENTDTPAYRFERTQEFSPVQMLKAIDCYEYQSCEHDGWEASSAKAFCTELRAALINRLPGYDDAPWGLSERGNAPISLFEMSQGR